MVLVGTGWKVVIGLSTWSEQGQSTGLHYASPAFHVAIAVHTMEVKSQDCAHNTVFTARGTSVCRNCCLAWKCRVEIYTAGKLRAACRLDCVYSSAQTPVEVVLAHSFARDDVKCNQLGNMHEVNIFASNNIWWGFWNQQTWPVYQLIQAACLHYRTQRFTCTKYSTQVIDSREKSINQMCTTYALLNAPWYIILM